VRARVGPFEPAPAGARYETCSKPFGGLEVPGPNLTEGTTMSDNIKSGVEKAGEKVKDVAEKAGQSVKDASETVAEKVGDAAKSVGDKVKEGGEKLKDQGR
jgi:hypothetical protein